MQQPKFRREDQASLPVGVMITVFPRANRFEIGDAMPPVSPPPQNVFDCGLLRSLKEKASKEEGAYALANALLDAATPLLDSIIAGPFEHYTLHNRDHAKKLLHLADAILPSKTVERLSVVEHLVLIYAAFLHDLGLSLSFRDRDRIITSPEFNDAARSWPELWAALNDARRKLLHVSEADRFQVEAEIFQLQEAALAAFIRPRHATPERYRGLISDLKQASRRNDLFAYRGASFEDWLIDVCVSHNSPASVLAEARGPYEERYPRDALVGGNRLNTQFCAVVLRLTDILDFDRERTPRILFESLGISYPSIPGAEVSLKEWQKHMSIHTLSIDAEEIVVAGDCRHPVVEKAVRDFCLSIEHEIRDSLAVLRRNAPETVAHYFLDLPIAVRPKIRSVGYVFKDMSLQLNQAAITSLLMGERLYSNRAVAIRELLQNAIDACGARRQLEPADYIPRITVSDTVDASDRHWIEVVDNGIGMDEHVLTEYFLTLGNSFYDSAEFRQMVGKTNDGRASFVPIARFGIGVASVFMLADLLEVQTRSFHSVFNDTTARTVRIERMGTLAFVTESTEGPIGTKIRIRVKPDLNDKYEAVAGAICGYLSLIAVRPSVDIEIRLAGKQPLLLSGAGSHLTLKESGRARMGRLAIEAVQIDVGAFSDLISGDVVLFFCVWKNGLLSHLWEKPQDQMRITVRGLKPSDFYGNYRGNLVAVNGFKMSAKKMSKILGLGRERIPLIFELNIKAGGDIGYDVARDHVTGPGKFKIAFEFREALLRAVAALKLRERLMPRTSELLEKVVKVTAHDSVRARGSLDTDEHQVMQAIQELVPSGILRKGMEKSIASQLDLPIPLISQAISVMVDRGDLTREQPEE
jgi:molecular chaperone HtpG